MLRKVIIGVVLLSLIVVVVACSSPTLVAESATAQVATSYTAGCCDPTDVGQSTVPGCCQSTVSQRNVPSCCQ